MSNREQNFSVSAVHTNSRAVQVVVNVGRLGPWLLGCVAMWGIVRLMLEVLRG